MCDDDDGSSDAKRTVAARTDNNRHTRVDVVRNIDAKGLASLRAGLVAVLLAVWPRVVREYITPVLLTTTANTLNALAHRHVRLELHIDGTVTLLDGVAWRGEAETALLRSCVRDDLFQSHDAALTDCWFNRDVDHAVPRAWMSRCTLAIVLELLDETFASAPAASVAVADFARRACDALGLPRTPLPPVWQHADAAELLANESADFRAEYADVLARAWALCPSPPCRRRGA